MKVRKILAMLVCVCMLVSMLPAAVFADGGGDRDWITITSYQAETTAKGKTVAVGGTLTGSTDVSFYVAAYNDLGQLLAVSDTVSLSAAGQWVCTIEMTNDDYSAFTELKTFVVSTGPSSVTPEKIQAELYRVTENQSLTDRDAFMSGDESNRTWLIEEDVTFNVLTDIDLEGAIINKGTVNIVDNHADIHGEIRVNGTFVNDGTFYNQHAVNVNNDGTFVNNGEYYGTLNWDGEDYESWFSVNSGGTLIVNENLCDNVICNAEFDSEGQLVTGMIEGDAGIFRKGDDEVPGNEYNPSVLLTVRNEIEFAAAIGNGQIDQIKPEGFILEGNYELRNGQYIYVEREMWDSSANEGNGAPVPNTFTLKDGSSIDAYQGTGIQFNNVLTFAGEITLHDDANLRFYGGNNDASETTTLTATSAINLKNNSWAEFRGTTDLYGEIATDDNSCLNIVSGDGDRETDVKTFTLKSGSSFVNNSRLELRGENGTYKGIFNDPDGCLENNGSLNVNNYEFNRPGFVTTRQQLKDALNSSEADIEIFVMFNAQDEQPPYYDMNSLESDGEYVLTVRAGQNVVITGIEGFDWGNNYINVHGVIVREGASLELKNMDIRLVDPDSYLTLMESETPDNGGLLTLTDATVEVDDNDWSPEAEDHTSIEIRKNACIEIGSSSVWGCLNFNGEIHNAGTIFAYSEFKFNQHNYFEGENGIIFETRNINSIADKISRDLNGIKTLAVEGLSNNPESLKNFKQNVIEPEQWARWIDDRANWDNPHYDDIYGMAVLIGIGAVTAPAEGYLDLSQPLDFLQIRSVLETVAKVATGSETIPEGELKEALDAYYDGEGDPRMHFWGGLRQHEENKWVEWEFDTLFENYKNALMLALPAEDSVIENIVVTRVYENDGSRTVITVDGEAWDGDEFFAYNFTKPVSISCDPDALPANEGFAGTVKFINCSFPAGVTLHATDVFKYMNWGGDDNIHFDVDFTDSCSGIVYVASPAGYPDGGDFRLYTDAHYGTEPSRIGVGGASGMTIYADNYTSISARGTVNVNGLTIARGTYPEGSDMNIDVRWDYNGEDEDHNQLVIHTIEVDTEDAYDDTKLVVISTAKDAPYSGKLRIAGGVDVSGVEFAENSWAEFSDCRGNNYFVLGGNDFYASNGGGNVTLNGGKTTSENGSHYTLVNGAELTSRNEWAEFAIGSVNLGQPHVFGENEDDFGIFISTDEIPAASYKLEIRRYDPENDCDYYEDLDYVCKIFPEDDKTHIERNDEVTNPAWFNDSYDLRLTVTYDGCKLVIDGVMLKYVSLWEFADRFFELDEVKAMALPGIDFEDDEYKAAYEEWSAIEGWPENPDDEAFFAKIVVYGGLEPRTERRWDDESREDVDFQVWRPWNYIEYGEAKGIVEGLYEAVTGKTRSIDLNGNRNSDNLLHYPDLNEFIRMFHDAVNTSSVSAYDDLVAALAGSNNTVEITENSEIIATGDICVPVGKRLMINEGAVLDLNGHDLILLDGSANEIRYDDERDNYYLDANFAYVCNNGTIITGAEGTLNLGYYSCFDNNSSGVLNIQGTLDMYSHGTAMLPNDDPDGDPIPAKGYWNPENPYEIYFCEDMDNDYVDWLWFDFCDGASLNNSGTISLDQAVATIEGGAGINNQKAVWDDWDPENRDWVTTESGALIELKNGAQMELRGYINLGNNTRGYFDVMTEVERIEQHRAVLVVGEGTEINMIGADVNNEGEITVNGEINMEGFARLTNQYGEEDGVFTGGIINVGTEANAHGSIELLEPYHGYDERGNFWVDGRSEIHNNGLLNVYGSMTDIGCSFYNNGTLNIMEGASFTETCNGMYPGTKGGEPMISISMPFQNYGVLNVDGTLTIGSESIDGNAARVMVYTGSELNIGENGEVINYSMLVVYGSEFYYDENNHFQLYEDGISVPDVDKSKVDNKGLFFVIGDVATEEGFADALSDDRLTDVRIETDLTFRTGDVKDDSMTTDKYVTVDYGASLTLDGVDLTINQNWIDVYNSLTLLGDATITLTGGEGLVPNKDYGVSYIENEDGLNISDPDENGNIVITSAIAFAESWDGLAAQLADPDVHIVVVGDSIISDEDKDEVKDLVIPCGKQLFITEDGGIVVTDGYSLTVGDGDDEHYTIGFNPEWNQAYIDTARSYMENRGYLTVENGGELNIGKLVTLENYGYFNAEEGSTVNISGSRILGGGIWTVNEDGDFEHNPSFDGENPPQGWDWLNLHDGGVLNNHTDSMTIAGTLNIAPYGALNNFSGIDDENGFQKYQSKIILSGTGNIRGSISNEVEWRDCDGDFEWCQSILNFEGANYTFTDGTFINRGLVDVDANSDLTFIGACFVCNDRCQPDGCSDYDASLALFELSGDMVLQIYFDVDDFARTIFPNYGEFRMKYGSTLTDNACEMQNNGLFDVYEGAVLTRNTIEHLDVYDSDNGMVFYGRSFVNNGNFGLLGTFNLSEMNYFENYGLFSMGAYATLNNKGIFRDYKFEERDEKDDYAGVMPNLDADIAAAASADGGTYVPIAIVGTMEGLQSAYAKDYVVASIDEDLVFDTDTAFEDFYFYISEYVCVVLNNCELTFTRGGVENEGDLILAGDSQIIISGTEYKEDYYFFDYNNSDIDVAVSEDEPPVITVIAKLPEGAAYATSWSDAITKLADENIYAVGLSGNISSEGTTTDLVVPLGKELYIMPWSSLSINDGYSLTMADYDSTDWELKYDAEGNFPYIDTARATLRNMGSLYLNGGSTLNIGKLETFENDGSMIADPGSTVNISAGTIIAPGIWQPDGEGGMNVNSTFGGDFPPEGWDWLELADGGRLNNNSGFIRIAGALNIGEFSELDNYSSIEDWDPYNEAAQHTGMIIFSGDNTTNGNIHGLINNDLTWREMGDSVVWVPSIICFEDADYTFGFSSFRNLGRVTVDEDSELNFIGSCDFENGYVRSEMTGDIFPAEFLVNGSVVFWGVEDKDTDDVYGTNFRCYGTFGIEEDAYVLAKYADMGAMGFFYVADGGRFELVKTSFQNSREFELGGEIIIDADSEFVNYVTCNINNTAEITNNGVIKAYEWEDEDEHGYTGNVPNLFRNEGIGGTVLYGVIAGSPMGVVNAAQKGYDLVYINANMTVDMDLETDGVSFYIDPEFCVSFDGSILTIVDGEVINDGRLELDDTSSIIIRGEGASFSGNDDGLEIVRTTGGEPEVTVITITKKTMEP